MGNICGKQEADDAFAQPGRRLGSAPPPAATTARVPASAGGGKRTVGGPPRTLGGGGPSSSSRSGGAPDDARRQAAAAAEARAQGSRKGGKLHNQLQAQKKQTMADTLREAGETERRRRDVDASVEAMRHD